MKLFDLGPGEPFYQPGAPEARYQDGQYFKLIEFACPLTKRIIVSVELLEALDALRERMGRALTISSGYRSPEYNRRVGGAANSQHLYGRAADIPFIGRDDALSMLEHAQALGFRGIGVYPSRMFIHLDVRPGVMERWGELAGKPVSYEDAVETL